MTIHANDFHERLARIEAGAGNTRHTVFVGMDDSFVVPKKVQAYVPTNRLEGLGDAIGRIWAVLLGGLAVLVVVIARYWTGLDSALPGNPFYDQGLMLLLSLGMAVLLSRLFFADRRGLLGRLAMGCLLASIGWHNVVHAYPVVFETLCSPAFVSRVLGETRMFSAVIGGETIQLL